MILIFYIIYIRLHYYCEIMLMKHATKMVYIYIGIILINTVVIFLYLGLVEMDIFITLSSTNNGSMEIGNPKILLKISQDNSDLVQPEIKAIESNKIDSVDANYKDKNSKSFLDEIHKRILHADRSYFPSHFQKIGLPMISEDVPIYGNKLVTFKSSSLLQDRNLPEMSIEIPKSTSTNMGKLTELDKAINGADEAVKLYDSQFIKFNKVICDIKNGTEKFYPNEAKPLMETYVDLVVKLSDQQKAMANEAITQLHKLDSKFSRDLYPVGHSGADGSGTSTGIVPDSGSGSGSGSSSG
jgi:hypothetical protein